MTTIGKMLLGSSILALAGGAVYFSRLKRLQANLEIVSSAEIFKVTLSGLTLRINVTMKNPTAGSLKVKFPFLKMKYKENTLASSTVEDKDYDIPKFGQVKLDPIYINLGFVNLATSAPALLSQYRKNGNLNITVETITTLNNAVPFSKTDNLTI